MGIRNLQEVEFEVPAFVVPMNFSDSEEERRQEAFRTMPKTSDALAADHILRGSLDPLAPAPIRELESHGDFSFNVAEFNRQRVGTVEDREFLFRALADATSGFMGIVSYGGLAEAKGMRRATKAMGREGKFFTSEDFSEQDLETLEEDKVSVVRVQKSGQAIADFMDSKKKDRGEKYLHIDPVRGEHMDTGRSTALVEVASAFSKIDHLYVPKSLGGSCLACVRLAYEVYGTNVRVVPVANPSFPTPQQTVQEMLDHKHSTGEMIGPDEAKILATVRFAARDLSGTVVAITSGEEITTEEKFNEVIKSIA